MTTSTRVIRVVIDPSQAQAGAAQVRAAMASIGATANGATGSINQANNAMNGMNRHAGAVTQSMAAANQNFVRSNNSILNMARSLGNATLALAGLTALTGGLVGLATVLTGAADKAAQVEAKLKNATNSTREYAAANATVRSIANATRSDLVATTDLYTKMAKNTKAADVATRTFAMSLKIGGATAQQSEAAILQLGQALGSGKLSGDEFTSLNENASRFMDILAQSMGVARGSLKALASEGKITGDAISKALTDPAVIAKIEEQFGRIPVTFGDVKVGISNAMIDIAAALKEGLGIDQSLAVMLAQIQGFAEKSKPFFVNLGQQIKATFATLAPVFKAAFAVVGPIVMGLVNNMESVVRVALSIGAAFAVMKASMGLQAVIGQVVALGTSMGATGGVAAVFSGVMTMARTAVNGFTAALLANPFTAIAVALTAGISLLVQFSDKIRLPGQEFGRLNDIVAVLFRDIKTHVGNVISGFVTFGQNVAKVFQAFMAIGRAAFGAIGSIASNLFNALDRMSGGFLGRVFGVLGNIVSGFGDAFSMVASIWNKLPTLVGSFVTSTANAVIGGLETMVNAAIGGLNKLIDLANKIPDVNIDRIGDVKFSRVQSPADYAASVLADAEARGRTRLPGPAASNPAANASTNLGNTSGAASAAGDAAKSANDMAKAMTDFWTKLEEARDSAGLMGIELERHNAILEYRKVLGDGDASRARELTDLEKQRINTLLQETATRKILADLEQSGRDRARETALLRERSLLLGTMSAEQVNSEMEIRSRMRELEAAILKDRGDLNSQAIKDALAREEASLRENAALREGNRLLEERQTRGRALLERYERERDPAGYAARMRGERDADLRSMKPKEGEDPAEFARRINAALQDSAREYEVAMNDITNRWKDQMLAGIDQIADAIGGKWGDAVRRIGDALNAIVASAQGDHSQSGFLGGLSQIFGGMPGNRTPFGQGMDSGAAAFGPKAMQEAFKDPMASLKGSFDGFANLFKNGSFAKSLGQALGAAGQGAQIGSAVAGVGKMLWKRFNETGSQIGGAIGGMIGGPIGSIIGSIGGGIIGGLLGGKQRYYASSKISMGSNGLTSSTTGNQAGLEGEAGQAGQSVIEGINAIAARLGVDATGSANVSIGKYKHLWKVSTSGGTVGRKHGIDFGEDQAAAIKFAIQDAIRDGVLVGLSSFSDRLLKNAKNLDSAIGLAEQYEKLLKELAAFKDPIGASISDLTKNLDRMVKSMKASGATSDELAKVEEFRKLKLDQMLKDNLSSLLDFRKELTGEGTGVTALSRLTAAQDEFARMHASILAGGNVNQDDFTRKGQEIFGLAREIYGTSSSQFQAIRQALMTATDGAISNVTDQFNDQTVVAIEQQTDAITTNQNEQTGLLRRIAELLGEGNLTGAVVNAAYNGRYGGAAV